MLRHVIAVAFFCGVALAPQALFAQTGLSISITPPLFQLTIAPGDEWRSSIKVVNNNPFDVPYYARVVDFQAQGEGGQGAFIPLLDGERELGVTLASWVEVPEQSISVSRGQSGEIPFTVKIPDDAPPGGHYAAILVGTEPPKDAVDGPAMKISSFVSSLIFVRISGEIEERGRIREFRSIGELYQTPKADFVLRFENIGNTHLRPQGEITLYNMWGKERGRVVINQQNGGFGSVLPESTRKYEFSWEGEQDISDIGRYSATVTLAYGENGRQSASARTYFWIVPVVPVGIALGSIALFLLLLVWFIRRYIRRALAIESARLSTPEAGRSAPPVSAFGTFVAPLREGVVDMRRIALQEALPPSPGEPPVATMAEFLAKYAMFFLFLLLIASGISGTWWYFSHTLTPERRFQVSDVKIEEVQVLELSAPVE